jgi:hypothetical protein
MIEYDPQYIDDEEKEIIESIKTMDVSKLQKPSKIEQDQIKAAAKQFMQKDTQMNIPMAPFDRKNRKTQLGFAASGGWPS